MTDVEIRPLGPDDDLDAQVDLGKRAFGSGTPAEWVDWRARASVLIGQGRFLGAFVGGRPAGAAAFHDMRQWWHGRPMPMAGVASVKIAPEYRGRGIGRRLVGALLDLIADHGYPVSALYPATMPIYRSLGWELAGSRYGAAVPSRELRALLAPDAALPDDGTALSGGGTARDLAAAVHAVGVRRAGPADAAEVNAVIGRAHEATRASGPLTWDTAHVSRWLSREDLFAYLADDGFVAYQWHDGDRELYVASLVTGSPVTARALWSVLASHSSTAGVIQGRFAPQDPLWWLTRERDVTITRRSMWMLRVVDAPAAIAARGFPPAVALTVPLVIADGIRSSNNGRWELAVGDGKGTLVPAGANGANGAHGANGASAATAGTGLAGAADGKTFTLGARGLAALYAGTPVATLRMAGLVSGGTPETDAALDAAFAAETYILDDF